MFFDNWHGLLRVLIVGVLAYASVVALLRATGNRTLSKMNSFDLIVTVALGSTLSSILISSEVALLEGVLALAALILFQFAITWLSVRSRTVSKLVKTSPTLLLQDGVFREEAMRSVRVTQDEVRSAVRQQGLGGLEDVGAVIMETDGSLAVISRQRLGTASALAGIPGAEQL